MWAKQSETRVPAQTGMNYIPCAGRFLFVVRKMRGKSQAGVKPAATRRRGSFETAPQTQELLLVRVLQNLTRNKDSTMTLSPARHDIAAPIDLAPRLA